MATKSSGKPTAKDVWRKQSEFRGFHEARNTLDGTYLFVTHWMLLAYPLCQQTRRVYHSRDNS